MAQKMAPLSDNGRVLGLGLGRSGRESMFPAGNGKVTDFCSREVVLRQVVHLRENLSLTGQTNRQLAGW